jgi:hypothetical protein
MIASSLVLSYTLFAEFPQELIRWHEEWVFLGRAADDHHRMSPQNLNDYVTTELGEVIKANNRILYRGKT